MQKFMGWLEVKMVPIATKLSNQRHMLAIRRGILATLPLTIVGSFFCIFLNLPIPGYAELIAPYLNVIDIPFRFTVGILALYAAYGIGSSLASHYKLDQMGGGMLATVAFLVSTVTPVKVVAGMPDIIADGRYLNISSLSSSSLFGAIVSSIVAIEIYRFCKEKNITIKMPDGVPPEVSNSFAALFPAAITILLFWGLRYFAGFDLNSLMSTILMPLKDLFAGNSYIGGILSILLIKGFWTLGIHGHAIMGPVIRPIWDMAIVENMEAFQSGASAAQLPNIWTEQFQQWFILIGGSGATLALVFMFLFSKSKYLNSLGRLSIIPGIFNINEPVIFGAPIVMNPILAIPFVLAPVVMGTVAYIATISGIVPMMMAKLPFTFPSPLGALMSTDWSIAAMLLVFINFAISFAIYYPFFRIFEKQQMERELKEITE